MSEYIGITLSLKELPMDVVPEVIVRRVRDDCAKANREGEEALRNGGIPNVGIQQLAPIWCDEKKNAIDCTLECDGPAEKRDEHNVGENS